MKLDISFLTSEAPGDKLMVYSSCGDLVGFFTGRHLTSVETLAGCAGDGDDQIETASRRAQAIMSSYNTIPALESEAQPLVAAPARKLGKTLVVVALFGFAAGAAAATAAPHVAARMNLAAGVYTNAADYDTSGKKTNDGYDGTGSIDIDGPPVPPADATTMTTPAQEPAQEPAQDAAIVNYFKDTAQEAQSTDCNKAGGETVTTAAKCSHATIQDAQVTSGSGGETVGSAK